jgi:hypothetical protein
VEEELQLQMWKALVSDLDDKLFQKAVVDLCHKTEKFWDTDNVPAMIRQRVEMFKEDTKRIERIDAKAKQIEQWAKDAAPMPEEFRKVLEAYKIPEGEERNADNT